MSGTNVRNQVAYGLSEALPIVFTPPIIANRAPLAKDKAPLGTIWIDKPNNDGYVLTSVVAGVATWIGIGGGPGVFTNVDASGYVHAGTNMQAGTTITAGTGITSTTGNIVATAGAVNAGTTMTAGTGITATTGNIVATAGAVNAGTTVTAGTGITATTGNIVASAGDITASGSLVCSAGLLVNAGGASITLGDLNVVAGDIIAVDGDIEADAGSIAGVSIYSTGDLGGVVSTTGITNVVDTTQSSGALSIVSASANPGTNAGFIKVYVGTAVAYVPYFTTIAP